MKQTSHTVDWQMANWWKNGVFSLMSWTPLEQLLLQSSQLTASESELTFTNCVSGISLEYLPCDSSSYSSIDLSFTYRNKYWPKKDKKKTLSLKFIESQIFALSEETAHPAVYLHLSGILAVLMQLDCWLRCWYTREWAVSSESVLSERIALS